MPQTAKPPSRRHLARVLSEAVPVVNEHADRLEYLKQRSDTLAEEYEALRHDIDARIAAYLTGLTWRQRLRLLVLGRNDAHV